MQTTTSEGLNEGPGQQPGTGWTCQTSLSKSRVKIVLLYRLSPDSCTNRGLCIVFLPDENANLGTTMRYEEIGEWSLPQLILNRLHVVCFGFHPAVSCVDPVNVLFTEDVFLSSCLFVVCRVTHLAPVWQWSPGVLLHPWPVEGQWCKHPVAPTLLLSSP